MSGLVRGEYPAAERYGSKTTSLHHTSHCAGATPRIEVVHRKAVQRLRQREQKLQAADRDVQVAAQDLQAAVKKLAAQVRRFNFVASKRELTPAEQATKAKLENQLKVSLAKLNGASRG